jgi:e3 binding domain
VAAQNIQRSENQGTAQRTGGQQSVTRTTQRAQQSGDSDEQQHSRAANVPSDQTAPEKEYSDYAMNYEEGDAAFDGNIPDVLLDAPVVKLDNLDFELDDLRAKVSLFAKVLDLVELSVGIDAYLGKVKLTIEAIEVQALLKVRLDNVRAILDRVLTTIDRNPQIIHELAKGVSSAVEDVGEGAGEAVEDVGEGAGQLVGEGANEAVSDIGSGAASAVEDVGEGAGSAVEDVGGGAGEAVGEVGQGAGQAAQEVGQGAGQATQEVGQGAGQATQQAGQVAQQAGEVAQNVGDAAGQATEQGSGQQETSQQAPAATQAAERLAENLGVDLTQIEGSGVGGRITVTDVRSAAQRE